MPRSEEITRICNEYISNRDNMSRRATQSSGVWEPQSKTDAMNEFVGMVRTFGMSLALELNLGGDLALWTAFSELVNSHLSELRRVK